MVKQIYFCWFKGSQISSNKKYNYFLYNEIANILIFYKKNY